MQKEIETHINELKASDYEVILKICEMYQVKEETFFSSTRKINVVNARHMAAYYFYNVRRYTKSKIAEMVSVPKKDHTTIISSIRKFGNFLDTEPYTADLYATLLMPRIEFTSLKYKPNATRI
jgi:chromosomal replication initiation ATPase DnaA